MKFCFGDIVVVNGNEIGVVVKSWIHDRNSVSHEVYCRMRNGIAEFDEKDMERYMVRHKYLDEDEQEYQHNAVNNL